ncbi:CCA tRNA nucleotidyltransferase [candidate division WOR-3 bacterium]|nr:CCA tRNA nucleotidyltransferase [candidate division WOR-3 bacterium]
MQEAARRALRGLGRPFERLLEIKGARRLFLVGGTIRDILLGREPTDFDLAVSGSGIDFAAAFARKVRGSLVILSEPDDEARVVYQRRITFDFNGYGDRTIEDDIRRRDFTANALAVEILRDGVGDLLDIVAGRKDIAERLLRPVTEDSLRHDPLRLLRAIRIALELDFRIDESVFDLGRSITLRETAPERIGAELLRIMECPGSYTFIRKLFDLGRLQDIMPELVPLLEDEDLREHSFRTYFKIEEIITEDSFFRRFEPEWAQYFDKWGLVEAEVRSEKPESRDQKPDMPTDISDQSAICNLKSEIPTAPGPQPPAPSPSPLPYRRGLLKLAGLLHDLAKPETRFVNVQGEVHFYGHDSLGARAAARIGRRRLRLSRAQTAMLSALVAEHMRLHLLATAPELTERAVRRFFRDLGEDAFGMMILCFADGWATAGRTGHLEDTISRMIEQRRAEAAKLKVKRYVTGHELIALGLKPGPAFKVILQELEDLQLEGVISSTEQGLDYVKAHLPGLLSESTKP